MKYRVKLFNSIATVKPRIVTKRAESFRWAGIVICGVIIGGMLAEMR